MKIKSLNLYSFMKMQGHNLMKSKSCKTALLNCFKIYVAKRKDLMMRSFRTYRNTIEKELKKENNKLNDNFQSN